jgi:transposase-like protein
MKTKRTFTREFKLDLCSRIEAGQLTKAQAGREHRLSQSLLDRWQSQFREGGSESFSDSAKEETDHLRRISQLEQALGQAHLEIKILRDALLKKGGRNGS